MVRQHPLAGQEIQAHCVAPRESLALRQQVVAELRTSEMGEATRRATTDGPSVAQYDRPRLGSPPPMPVLVWRPAPPLTHQMPVPLDRLQGHPLPLLWVQGLSHWDPHQP